MLRSNIVEREIFYNFLNMHFCRNSWNNGATLVWNYTMKLLKHLIRQYEVTEAVADSFRPVTPLKSPLGQNYLEAIS